MTHSLTVNGYELPSRLLLKRESKGLLVLLGFLLLVSHSFSTFCSHYEPWACVSSLETWANISLINMWPAVDVPRIVYTHLWK